MSISDEPAVRCARRPESRLRLEHRVSILSWLSLPLVVALSGCSEDAPPPSPRPVETMVVAPAEGGTTAVYSGEVVSRYEAQLGFRTAGTIVAKLVDVGDTVTAGQPLARLDPADAQLGVGSASAQASAAASAARQQTVDLARAQKLATEGFISPAELDRQRVGTDQARAQARSAQTQLQGANRQLGYTVLRAEQGGVVTMFNGAAGQVVSAGQPVATVAAPGALEAAISIPEGELASFSRAQLFVTVWAFPNTHYAGHVRTLSPAANRQTRTFDARVTFDAPLNAAPIGATIEVSARSPVDSAALRLPVAAVSQRDGSAVVWIVAGTPARVAPRRVRIVQVQQNAILVVGGVKPGERVVTAGVHLLHPGDVVQPVQASADVLR